MSALEKLHRQVVGCKRCPRLVRWREEVALTRVRRYADWTYWGKPVPGFGDPDARLLMVGLAPAAHGANRTGRMFTGDRSGDWLYAALHRFGFANQPCSVSRDDGLVLTDCYITAVCRCAPPGNKPLPEEIGSCRQYLLTELRALESVTVIVALGKIAFDAVLQSIGTLGVGATQPRPTFTHGVKARLNPSLTLIGSYHPSQQNTFTGRLTRPTFHSVFRTVRRLLPDREQ